MYRTNAGNLNSVSTAQTVKEELKKTGCFLFTNSGSGIKYKQKAKGMLYFHFVTNRFLKNKLVYKNAE